MTMHSERSADGLEGVDHLLRDFFRSELPQPWPKCPVPASLDSPKPKRIRNLQRAYVGLTACCAFVALGLGAAWNLLRFDQSAATETGILPSAAKPTPKGAFFRTPPAASPRPASGDLHERPRPLDPASSSEGTDETPMPVSPARWY